MPKGIYSRPSAPSRFWKLVKKSPRCWVWEGIVVRRYGGFHFKGKLIKAHRFSWVLRYGQIPPGSLVCHKCDNPLCVRPSHLFLGTHKTNAEDRESKGRGKHETRRGERNGSAKLTEAQVKAMRQLRKKTGMSYAKIGKAFGVCTMQTHDIIKGVNWSHVEDI